jgi:hypothetical protein
MRYKFVLFSLLAALLLAVGSPAFASPTSAATPAERVATAPQTPPAILDKTRFLLHAGAGFYAFHHFVWARYKNGGFSASDPHRKSNIVKAGIALLFAYHEFKVAYGIASKSSSKTLQVLVMPLNKLGSSVSAVATKLKGGHYSDTDIQSLNDNINSFGKLSGTDGYTIKDTTVPVPGAA